MSLYRRKGEGPWYYHFEIAGKRYRASTKTTDRKEAERRERRAYTAAERGESLTPQKAPVLRDFAKDFLDFINESRLASQSKRDYRNGWRLISKTRLAGMRIDTITGDDIETTKFHESPYSTNSAIRTLRRMLHHAKDHKKIQEVPRVSTVEAPGRNMLVMPEVELSLLSRFPQPLHDVFTIILDAGMRPGEVIRMRWEYLNLAAGSYRNPKGKTPRARRTVPLSARAVALLKFREPKLQGFVFHSEKSKSGHIELHKLQLRFRKICREIGLPEELTMYCARHTYGTAVMEDTGDPSLVMETMGHADLKTTKVYLHPRVDRAKEAIDRRNEQKQAVM